MVRLIGTLVLMLALGLPGSASACRLALLLALDVSSSVDAREHKLQRDGLAAALTAPEVSAAFLAGGEPVALSAYEWSGKRNHRTILTWRLILSHSDLSAAASEVLAAPRSADDFPTALGYALGHAATLLADAPVCDRRTIDVSGDGENNDGFAPRLAYRHFPLAGVTVNALVIGGADSFDQLVGYFRSEVIHGPGAFVETATDYSDFERAIRRKLEREVSSRVVGAVR